MREVVGIVRGLGPLASSRFLATIYRSCRGVPEQETPRILLLSDPTFPDRTKHFLRGEVEEILARAIEATRNLQLWAQTIFSSAAMRSIASPPDCPQKCVNRTCPSWT